MPLFLLALKTGLFWKEFKLFSLKTVAKCQRNRYGIAAKKKDYH